MLNRSDINDDTGVRAPGRPDKNCGGRTTEQFARDNLVQPQTVRKRYSLTGGYFNVVPEKLSNGRLKWP
jgi:hypothetical protein